SLVALRARALEERLDRAAVSAGRMQIGGDGEGGAHLRAVALRDVALRAGDGLRVVRAGLAVRDVVEVVVPVGPEAAIEEAVRLVDGGLVGRGLSLEQRRI